LTTCKVLSANFNMSEFHEQRVNIKFCVELGKTFTETHEMLKHIYEGQCMGRTLLLHISVILRMFLTLYIFYSN
jgi:hypothetical protein